MAVTVYKNTDASAPVLTGSVGDLVNVLDKCLVAGYGSKAAAGWTKPYTGTNGAVFRQGGGNQFYLYVNDNAPVTAKSARVRGYEAMDSFTDTPSATVTGPFPTAAQQTNTGVRKSNTADATARGWIVVADNRTFYFFVGAGDTAGCYQAFMFGDFYSLLTADGYRTALISRISANEDSATSTTDVLQTLAAASTPFAAVSGHYFARGYTGVGGSVNFAKIADHALTSNSTSMGIGTLATPNPTDGGYYLSRVYIHDGTTGGVSTRRGWMRGLWNFGHPVAGVVDGDTFTGSGDLAGRTFLVIKSGPNSGLYVVEISNTWDTSS